MNLNQIYFDYRSSIRQAEKLEEAARQLKKLADSEMEETFAQLNASWHGNAADHYCKKGRRLREQMSQTAKQIAQTAETLRKIAEHVRNTELRAYEIATKREK